MTNNVSQLTGEPNARLIDSLDRMLRQAKAGKITRAVLAYEADERLFYTIVGHDPLRAAGLGVYLQTQAMKQVMDP